MSVVGIDVGQQGAHDGRYTRAHVLRRQAGKVTATEKEREREEKGQLDGHEKHNSDGQRRQRREWPTVRHGLVDGLHPVTHGELVHNLLGGLLKVHLPGVVAFGVRDLHHTVVLDISDVVEEVLRGGRRWKERKREGKNTVRTA